MTTRKELIEGVGQRYRASDGKDKPKILEEFVRLTGYHRKHAIRVLNCGAAKPVERRPRERIYNDAVRQALIVLWEAADRICSKRLKAAQPLLIVAMERHGHLALDGEVRQRLLAMSTATIDRLLDSTRREGCAGRRRRGAINSALRKSIPIRTFADWKDVKPGFFEIDFVEHCGGVAEGTFVHSLVLTDVASGWTECVALPAREQTLVIEGFAQVRAELPFPLQGVNSDNDSAFINDTVVDYCRANDLVFTRSRPYRKNDQAWVEQKNGAVVRRLVGYGRLQGREATAALARLYAVARLYVNFFQPSFKLASKTREGSHVIKRYLEPATPCARLLACGCLDAAGTTKLQHLGSTLDPVALLHEIRSAQEALAAYVATGSAPTQTAGDGHDLDTFVRGLATAWKSGETRPTHRRKATVPHWWRSRADPFEHTWPTVEKWLQNEPGVSAKDLMQRLAAMMPDVYSTTAQLRTLQRRVKAWRSEQAKQLIFATLKPAALHADANRSATLKSSIGDDS
jgi:Integrase core domain